MELPREGELVAGKYTIERTLGAGAMGVVVSALHLQLGERVALKFLNPDMAKNPEVVARFLREAQSAARIKGEHVAHVTDVGTLDSGIPYLVMEYLDGRDLGDWIETKSPISLDLAVELILQACEALAEAHAMGIVHRDLKPANLFVATRSDGSPLVKVLDFGIAKLLKDTGRAQLTALGAVMGSPIYMSPELLSNAKGVDARSDVWQVGCILHEALTGKPAFDGDSLNEVIIAIATKPAARIRASRPDVPQAIDDVVSRCLEKDPGKRLQDVAAIAEALSPFATTRRGQVSVEHTLTLTRGPNAQLPPMRAPMRSSVSLLRAAPPPSGSVPAMDPLGATMMQDGPSPSAPPRSAPRQAPAASAPQMAANASPHSAANASPHAAANASPTHAGANATVRQAAAAPEARGARPQVTDANAAATRRKRAFVAIAVAASLALAGAVALATHVTSAGPASAQPASPPR